MIYIVKKGDTIYQIAKKYNLSTQDLIDANPQIKDPNKIYEGQQITVPETGKAPNGGANHAQPGVPGQKPLSLLGVTLANGANLANSNSVPLMPTFTLQFDKNVVNNSVWQKNQNSITLSTATGQSVPITVSKMSDKIDFSQRQKIYVTPVNPLTPGTTYVLTISPQLQAQNDVVFGSTTGGQSISISFTTTSTT